MQSIHFQGSPTFSELPSLLSMDPKIALATSLCAAQAAVVFKESTRSWLPGPLNILYSIAITEFVVSDRDKSDLGSLALFAASLVGVMYNFREAHRPKSSSVPPTEKEQLPAPIKTGETPEPRPLPTLSFETLGNPLNFHPINFTSKEILERAKAHMEEAKIICEHRISEEDKKTIVKLQACLSTFLFEEKCEWHFELIRDGYVVSKEEFLRLKKKSKLIINVLRNLKFSENRHVSQIKLLLACDLLNFAAVSAEVTAGFDSFGKKKETILTPFLREIYCSNPLVSSESTKWIDDEQPRWNKKTLDEWNKTIHPNAKNLFLSSLKRLNDCCHTSEKFPYKAPANGEKAVAFAEGLWNKICNDIKLVEKKDSFKILTEACKSLVGSQATDYASSEIAHFLHFILDQNFQYKNDHNHKLNRKPIHIRYWRNNKQLIPKIIKELNKFVFPKEEADKMRAAELTYDILQVLAIIAEACSPKPEGKEMRECSSLYGDKIVQPLFTTTFEKWINVIDHKPSSDLILKGLRFLHESCHTGKSFAFEKPRVRLNIA